MVWTEAFTGRVAGPPERASGNSRRSCGCIAFTIREMMPLATADMRELSLAQRHEGVIVAG